MSERLGVNFENVHDHSVYTEDHGNSATTHPNAEERTIKKKKKCPILLANTNATRYDIVVESISKAGFRISNLDREIGECYLIWSDMQVQPEIISALKPFQRINHFPGMGEICRKDNLAKNLTKMHAQFSEDYNIFPRTWIMPGDYSAFKHHCNELRKLRKWRTYIVKPPNGSMGNGIHLVRNPESIPKNESLVVQDYLSRPFLIDGYKFDLRVYVLITSCDPLRAFLFGDGLVRLSTQTYEVPTESNIEMKNMHLTNYSLNKHSENYIKNDEIGTGSKRSIKYLNDYLREKDYDTVTLWHNIKDVLVKTLLVAHPHVLHAYQMCRPGHPSAAQSLCFEILGFDIFLDHKLKPHLIEINRAPSFGTDSQIDYDIKSELLMDSIKLLRIRASDKRKMIAVQKSEARKRLTGQMKPSSATTLSMNPKQIKIQRRKQELLEMLAKIRIENKTEDYENRHLGGFSRLYPSDEVVLNEKYASLSTGAFRIFHTGRSHPLHWKDSKVSGKLKEGEVLDMLEEVEADETGKSRSLTSMPSVSYLTAGPPAKDANKRVGSGNSSSSLVKPGGLPKKPYNNACNTNATAMLLNRLSMVPNVTHKVLVNNPQLTTTTLHNLSNLDIKFPGKSRQEAAATIAAIYDNWKFHKRRVATYWLVKLDSGKQRKLIEIVQGNTDQLLDNASSEKDASSSKLVKIFGKLYNRMLWNHGQGLWQCFESGGDHIWEVMFTTSGKNAVTEEELACCRMIVTLCKQCLLIVYLLSRETEGQTDGAGQPARGRPELRLPANGQLSLTPEVLPISYKNGIGNLHKMYSRPLRFGLYY